MQYIEQYAEFYDIPLKEYTRKLKSIRFSVEGVDEYTEGDRTFYVYDDGKKYKYGTKQRITKEYVSRKSSEGFTDFVYAGPINAMGAFALAEGCVNNNVKCTLFLIGTYLTPQSKGFPSTVKINLVKNNLSVATEMAENYVKSNPDSFLVPFGINDKLYTSLLKDSIKADLRYIPKRMWLAVGSGVILSVLLELLPDTEFHAVQVGKSLSFVNPRVVIYKAPEKFSQPAEIRPPYNSLLNYDAKVWRFVLQFGEDGDAIWNVARNFS